MSFPLVDVEFACFFLGSTLSKVNIRFDPDLWPAKLPLVRFRGVPGAYLDDSRENHNLLYAVRIRKL